MGFCMCSDYAKKKGDKTSPKGRSCLGLNMLSTKPNYRTGRREIGLYTDTHRDVHIHNATHINTQSTLWLI